MPAHSWDYIASSLLSLAETGLDLKAQLSRIFHQQHRPRLLDWGCGTGQALKELSSLKGSASRLQLFGLSDIAYPQWLSLPASITIILDDGLSLGHYLARNSLDLIYSHWGILHLAKNRTMEKKAHLSLWSSLLTEHGQIITNTTRSFQKTKQPLFSPELLKPLGFELEKEGHIYHISKIR